MTVKELIVAIVITLLLIGFFSMAGYSIKELYFSRSGVPTTLGDTGVTVSGGGYEAAEMAQAEMPGEAAQEKDIASIDAETECESREAQAETQREERENNCDLIPVFLSGVAAVLLAELIVFVKSKI